MLWQSYPSCTKKNKSKSYDARATETHCYVCEILLYAPKISAPLWCCWWCGCVRILHSQLVHRTNRFMCMPLRFVRAQSPPASHFCNPSRKTPCVILSDVIQTAVNTHHIAFIQFHFFHQIGRLSLSTAMQSHIYCVEYISFIGRTQSARPKEYFGMRLRCSIERCVAYYPVLLLEGSYSLLPLLVWYMLYGLKQWRDGKLSFSFLGANEQDTHEQTKNSSNKEQMLLNSFHPKMLALCIYVLRILKCKRHKRIFFVALFDSGC